MAFESLDPQAQLPPGAATGVAPRGSLQAPHTRPPTPTLVASMSCCQCRGRMAGERRSATSGTDVRKFLTTRSRP
jgi:hypothetical protein